MSDATTQIETLIDGLNLTDDQVEQLTANLATLKTNLLLETDANVAKAKEGTKLTAAGFNLLGKALAGKELHYTRVAFGDSLVNGVVTIPSDEETAALTDLLDWKIDLPMVDVSFSGAGTATVKFNVNNAEIEEGFWIRELGLFAEDPDTGEEILYCYRNSGLLSSYVPAGGGAEVWNFIMSIVTVVDAATNITAVIDANLAFITQAELLEHVNSDNPHPNVPMKSAEVIDTDYFWTTGFDNNLHPLSVKDARDLILCGDASNLPLLESRLSQTEINLSNLYMQLNAERELGLQANLLLVEDFADNKSCDTYECVVNTQAAGTKTITVASDKDILNGHYYTLTDGIHAEYLRVKSVARNGTVNSVIFEDKMVYTYNLACTRLMRSTTSFSSGEVTGSGDLRGVSYDFSATTWTGTGTNQAVTLTLNTSNTNAANFTVTGDGAFNSSGEFTLTA